MSVPRLVLFDLPISLSHDRAQTMATIGAMLEQGTGGIVTFINPYSFYVGRFSQAFISMLGHFDLVLPDGIGVVKAINWITGHNVDRQSFDDTSLFRPFMTLLASRRESLCIVGGRPGIAEHALIRMKAEFPSVRYLGCLDGYQPIEGIIAWIERHQPRAVIVGMGSPHQERVLLRLRQAGFNGVGVTCGGFLDQYTENNGPYYPWFIDRMNLRWLYRLWKEPGRLAQRYLLQYRFFVISTIASVVRARLPGQHA